MYAITNIVVNNNNANNFRPNGMENNPLRLRSMIVSSSDNSLFVSFAFTLHPRRVN